MLINARNSEELRIAIVHDKNLENYQVEVAEQGSTRGNIYRGIISSIQPSLNAAFIDYGAERNGFLAIQDVVEEAYYRQPKGNGGRPRIEDVLDKGRPIVVQVTREAEGTKGAGLTTNLSLAGRYLVLTPFDDTRGISRKVEGDDDRTRLRQLVGKLKLPKGCGVIVRTNALDQNQTALSRDLAALLRTWKRVETEARAGLGKKAQAKLLYSDQDLVLQSLRDHLDTSIEEVLVDDPAAFEQAQEYMKAFMPRAKTQLVLYEDRQPLFSRFEIERQIDRIYERSVALPSGGSIVIDRTEALTAIDVNSGRANRAASQEETALQTNLEAAREVARQLRLRDLGGLMVVDFIDMRSRKNQRKLEKVLKDSMKEDRARSTIGRISPNGLLEINRQRIQQALSLRSHRPCSTCKGTGRIPSPELMGLNLLRRIAARAASGPLSRVRVLLHPELAEAIQNGRRRELAELEKEFDIHVEIAAAHHLSRADQEIEWFQREKVEEMGTRPARDEAASIRASILVASEAAAAAERRKKEPAPKVDRGGAEASGGGERASRATEGGGEAAPGDEGKRRPRRRRRRGRRSAVATGEVAVASSNGNGHPREETTPPAEASASPAPAVTAANGQSDGGEGTAPKPARRRRRRTSRSPRKTVGDEAADGKAASPAEP
jgi:ribonuclease E